MRHVPTEIHVDGDDYVERDIFQILSSRLYRAVDDSVDLVDKPQLKRSNKSNWLTIVRHIQAFSLDIKHIFLLFVQLKKKSVFLYKELKRAKHFAAHLLSYSFLLWGKKSRLVDKNFSFITFT